MALKLLNQAFSKREMAASTGKTLNPQKTEEIIGMYFVWSFIQVLNARCKHYILPVANE